MRILLLTPGTGHFFCGSCLRDNALGLALRELGHDVILAPLYLPFYLEEEQPDDPVHMGGVNVFVHEKLPWLARLLPGFLHDALDRPGFLRWAARQGDMTDAGPLGEMTVSMLRGEEGRQAVELDKLVEWMSSIGEVDVICLSNAMLAGIAHRLKAAFGKPLVCTLQGEAPFLEELHEPYRQEAWKTLAQRAQDIDLFLAVSRWHGELMAARMGVDADRVRVVMNGIELADFEADAAPDASGSPDSPGVPAIGYLARMCADKGLPTLVDAFIELKQRPGMEAVRLRVAGVMLKPDKQLVNAQRVKLARAGLTDQAEFHPNVTKARKLELLRSFSVLSVPATYGESFGLYLLEALAVGVPVVQPRHAAFPEVLEATGGGVLCEPDDPHSLADALAELIADPEHARRLGAAGRRRVHERFSAARMARDFAAALSTLTDAPAKSPS